MCRCAYTPQKNHSFNDFELPISLAKEMCMVSKSKKSGMLRKYFIACEEAWNSPEMRMARALQDANNTIMEHQRKVEQLTYTVELLTHDDDTFSFREIAKELGLKEKDFKSRLNLDKIIYKQGHDWLCYSKYQESGYFSYKSEIQENGYKAHYLKVTSQGRNFLINKYGSLFS